VLPSAVPSLSPFAGTAVSLLLAAAGVVALRSRGGARARS
jgi:hypothetical protein